MMMSWTTTAILQILYTAGVPKVLMSICHRPRFQLCNILKVVHGKPGPMSFQSGLLKACWSFSSFDWRPRWDAMQGCQVKLGKRGLCTAERHQPRLLLRAAERRTERTRAASQCHSYAATSVMEVRNVGDAPWIKMVGRRGGWILDT